MRAPARPRATMLAKWFLDASYDALGPLEHRGAFLPAFGRPTFARTDFY